MKKICVVGSGPIGESTAQILAQRELCQEIVLIANHEDLVEAAVVDLLQSAALLGFDTRVRGSTDMNAVVGADAVIISAGTPEPARLETDPAIDASAGLVAAAARAAGALAPEALLLVVSDPAPLMTHIAWHQSGLERERVIGVAGALDAARMASLIAIEAGLSVRDVRALVMGRYGDTVLPLPRYSTISGIPVSEFLSEAAIERVLRRMRQGTVLPHRAIGNSVAPAEAVVALIDAVARNRSRILPAVCVLDGEYGETGVALDVPAVIGGQGIEKIVELPLNVAEQQALHASAGAVRADLARLPPPYRSP